MLNYQEIGLRIRNFRRAANLSQEELAEKIDISTTHMSHIETGNTKLSLPVLVSLSQVLHVSTDDLLFSHESKELPVTEKEIFGLLEDCSPKQTAALLDSLKALKEILNRFQ